MILSLIKSAFSAVRSAVSHFIGQKCYASVLEFCLERHLLGSERCELTSACLKNESILLTLRISNLENSLNVILGLGATIPGMIMGW